MISKKTTIYFILLYSILYPNIVKAQTITGTHIDTIHQLKEVEIHHEPITTITSTSPIQTITSKDFTRKGILTVSDAARHLAGVQVKDYGGIGGIKTISLRNLGASFTGISYDGIPLTDNQTGQIDLGRITLATVESITVNTGNSDNIFQTAHMQSLAGSINITTISLLPEQYPYHQLKAQVKSGSFGLLNPSITYSKTINKHIAASLSIDYTKSKGNYPYRQTIGNPGHDTIVKRIRKNSEVQNIKSEANIYGKLNNGGTISMKIHTFHTDRQLPGPAIYYNDYSRDNLRDHNTFIQASYRQTITSNTDIMINARFSNSSSNYQSASLYQYFQRELFTSSVIRHNFSKNLSLSFANDYISGSINGNIINGTPHRSTWLSALSGKYRTNSINITAKLLYTYSKTTKNQQPSSDEIYYNNLSPYLGISIKPLRIGSFRIRIFFKENFRLPTLTDIYYSPAGQRQLKPENAQQLNLGLTFMKNTNTTINRILLSADIYHNKIKNKITAFPTNDINIWTIMNTGKVDINGIDLKAEAGITTFENFPINAGITYTYNKVLDKTNPAKENYNRQLPYTPRHSSSSWTSIRSPWIELNYTVLYSGKRYSESSNRPVSQMKPFTEHTVTLCREFTANNYRFTVSAECINITDSQYEIIRSYPMQGRTFRIQLTIEK
jgi:outer membrane cobalamin receptor